MDRLLGLKQGVAASVAAVGLAAAAPAWAGDAVQGKVVFTHTCSTCHPVTKGAAPILGPTLFGLVDRPSASVKGFAYSTAMKSMGVTWTVEELRAYLSAPNKLVPGTKMTFAGIKNAGQVDDLIAYLSTLK